MKILIVNYRFFVSGGPERYMFNLMDLLSTHGHQVIPFSIKYSQNVSSEYDKFFATPLSNENEVYFRDQSWNFRTVVKTMERLFFSREVYGSLDALIKETKPDFAIVQNYIKKLSPSVLVALSDNRVPFIVRLSDFAMFCPGVHLFRDGAPCELCIHGSLLNSVRYRCVHNSFGASLMNYAATQYHELKGFFELVKYFVVPSSFTKKMMVEAGWSDESVIHVPTFVYPRKGVLAKKKNQMVYLGRLEHIKGVELLLEAIGMVRASHPHLDFSMVFAGGADDDYLARLKAIVAEKDIQAIAFRGNLGRSELMQLVEESLFSVSPSLWYDNSPNAVLESLACGTPVIAPRHGSFPEIVVDGKTGLLFEPANAFDLATKIVSLLEHPEACALMGTNAVEFVSANHSPDKHYGQLMSLYSNLVTR